jgi:hypothetical protein
MTSETKLPTRSWDEIEARYRESVDAGVSGGGMLRFVEQIKGSSYARALHAWTSMHDLCIVQVPCTYPYDGPYLCIAPRFDGTIEFRYIDTYVASKQWHRVVKEEDAFGRLERFMDQLHWVVREKKQDAASCEPNDLKS